MATEKLVSDDEVRAAKVLVDKVAEFAGHKPIPDFIVLDRAQVERILLHDANQGIAVGGRWDGWLMFKHPDGQWVTVKKLEEGRRSLTSTE